MTYEHDPLWIAAMVMVSAISTLTALILQQRNARAARAPGGVARATPAPSPPLLRPRGEEGGGGGNLFPKQVHDGAGPTSCGKTVCVFWYVAVRCGTPWCVAAACGSLRHLAGVAERCVTLRHIAVRCSTLRRVAACCGALRLVAQRCGTPQCLAARCGTLQELRSAA